MGQQAYQTVNIFKKLEQTYPIHYDVTKKYVI